MGLGYQHEQAARRLRARRLPCWICGQPIDYKARHPDPNSFSLDHVKPRHTHPHLAHDPANHRAAHLGCNSSRQTTDPRPGLGTTTRDW